MDLTYFKERGYRINPAQLSPEQIAQMREMPWFKSIQAKGIMPNAKVVEEEMNKPGAFGYAEVPVPYQGKTIMATRDLATGDFVQPPKPQSKGNIKAIPVQTPSGIATAYQDADTGEWLDPSKLQPDQLKAQQAALNQTIAVEKAKSALPNAGDITFSANVEVGLQKLDQLEEIVKKHGNAEYGWLTAPEAAAALKSLPYDLAVTSAKIMDPTTAAREGEVELAQKYQIPMGYFTRAEETLAAIKDRRKTFLSYRDAYKKARNATQGASGDSAVTAPAASAKQAGGLPTIGSQAEFDKLPKGTRFTWNGKAYIK